MTPLVCSVALPLPSPQPYRYRIPTALADRVRRGARVLVPVRSGEMLGIVLECGDGPVEGLKAVYAAPDVELLLREPLLALAQWVARYYAAPIGLALRATVPAALWGRSRLVAELRVPGAEVGGASREVIQALERASGRATAAALAKKLRRPVWDTLQRLARAGVVALDVEPPELGPAAGRARTVTLTRSLPSLLERERVFGRAARQRAAYEAIDALGGDVELAHLTGQLGFAPTVLRALVERGVARFGEREALRDPFRDVTVESPTDLTGAQRDAVRALQGLAPGETALLFGVTGSGKTVVYLEALRDDVAHGRGAIVLVPEIALTPQTVARVRGVFGDIVAVLHSGLSDGERADAWRALASGRRRVVVGPRSAVFAPVANLAAIVVDEEHDASYKHGEVPRYHARDVAVRRAQLEGARLVLGSATPSLDVWAVRDRVRLVRLPERVSAPRLPTVQLVDLRTAPRVAESGPVPWSEALDAAVAARLAQGEQVMLLLNRRGFAHYLQCPSCGLVPECPSCSIALTVHQTPPALRCHYCGHREPVAAQCARCGHATQRMRGVGTQTLERWLAERFPRARLARMDADTTSTKWSHRHLLDAFGRHELDLLFGTQMIAKGLDFPDVTLVGVVDADTGLHVPDFRAAERTFQLVAQVAGRAGRGPRGGEVLVQTRSPDHPALRAAAAHDYEGFASRELESRRSPPYPPHVALANVVISGTREQEVARGAADVAAWLRGLVEVRQAPVEVLGPAPAPLARIKQRWRWHLVLRSPDRLWVGRLVRYAARRAPHAGRGGDPVRVVFDRDPVSLL
uniref:Replication restart protein PriA n=1 Tax=uncultured Gemmatimonadetes bacterium Rifle_16ft_4_minimus_7 TaxID=1665098 RepID=A0A0H4TCS0_9BACT|nr:primosomal protein N', primosomal protein N' [uncultured Gemmatimonadetes bacterium Rifle_16ft_4_minimus_7]